MLRSKREQKYYPFIIAAMGIAFVILVILFFQLATSVSQLIMSRNAATVTTVVDTNFVVAPEWQAVRDQYEVSYAPVTINFVVAPEWQAVRDQYEVSYAPVTTNFVVAPEWQAVRDQYEVSYAPAIHLQPTFTVAPEWIALRQQYESGYGYVAPEVRRP